MELKVAKVLRGAFLKDLRLDLEAPIDNSILNYLRLIKCAVT